MSLNAQIANYWSDRTYALRREHIAMGYAAEKSPGVSLRRRPEKKLRRETRDTINLSGFVLVKPAFEPAVFDGVTQKYAVSHTITSAARRITYPIITQPVDRLIVKTESAASTSAQLCTAGTMNQLTLAIISSLLLGGVIGSTAGYRSPILYTPQQADSTSRSLSSSEVEESVIVNIETIPPSGDTHLPIAMSNNASVEFDQYKQEIDWLIEQNSVLTLANDVFLRESLELTRELLYLELEVVSLRAQPELAKETGFVYNFVNVPIGSPIPEQHDGEQLSLASVAPAFSSSSGFSDGTVYDDQLAENEWQNIGDANSAENRDDLFEQDSAYGYYPEDNMIRYTAESEYYIDPELTADSLPHAEGVHTRDTSFQLYVDESSSYIDQADSYTNEPQVIFVEGEEMSYPPLPHNGFE